MLLLTTAFMLCSQVADAHLLRVTYAGHVDTGIDNSGVFGKAGSIVGARYVASFVFDDAFGTRSSIPPYLDSVIGGTFLGTSTPSRGAILKIDGVSFRFSGSNLGLHSQYPLGAAVSSYASDASPANPFNASFLGQSLMATDIPVPFGASFERSGLPAAIGFTNSFQIANGPGLYLTTYASGILLPNCVKVVPITSIPEPATWTLMIMGFTLSGLFKRKVATITVSNRVS